MREKKLGKSTHNKGCIWVNDGVHNKSIHPEELYYYIDLGYVKGCVTKGRKIQMNIKNGCQIIRKIKFGYAKMA